MRILLVLCCILYSLFASAQVDLSRGWKIKSGDNAAYAKADYPDQDWGTVQPTHNWEQQSLPNYDGFAWYRVHFKLTDAVLADAYLKDSIRILLGPIDDVEATYLNGVYLGGNGVFPDQKEGYRSAWDLSRRYVIARNHPALRWNADNVLAVRVYDGGGPGGFFTNTPRNVGPIDLLDFIHLDVEKTPFDFSKKEMISQEIEIRNHYKAAIQGTLTVTVFNAKNAAKSIKSFSQPIQVAANAVQVCPISLPKLERAWIQYEFKESKTGKSVKKGLETPYILTPPEPLTPKINNPAVYGARPGVPFLYKIAATGRAPLAYAAKGFPPGLRMNAATGVISGTVNQRGMFSVTITATNSQGADSKTILLVIGDNICLTPPLGWNSWNCWGLSVSDEKVRASADALVKSGLINHGWTYINIDDGWEAPKRDSVTGAIFANDKFPNMPALGDYLHKQGMKMGIYSSPGPLTCGGYLGSWQHEAQDAQTWADWGVDYLKHDWCSYGTIAPKVLQKADLEYPYAVMRAALNATNRDIVYSLCQYGMGNVWNWGEEVGGNLWRTTGDITDTWESMSSIGFSQDSLNTFARPGHWNDPDMLVVGWLGWGDHLHPSRLTPSEQYTHISLWAMLSAPLLIGCDLSRIDDFTYNLLANDEVIAIDQDPEGKQAVRKIEKPDYQIWVKELSDGSKAVAVFNLSETDQTISINWAELGLKDYKKVRDVWRQKDLGKFGKTHKTSVYSHGVSLLRVY